MGFMSATSAPSRSLHFKGIAADPSLPNTPKSCKPPKTKDGCIKNSGHACSYWVPMPGTLLHIQGEPLVNMRKSCVKGDPLYKGTSHVEIILYLYQGKPLLDGNPLYNNKFIIMGSNLYKGNP